MYFLVFSDSHGHAWRMAEAIRLHPEVRQVLFLGDGLRDMREIADGFPALQVRCVRGNCDGLGEDAPLTDLFVLYGHRILLLHGHHLGVKSGPERAVRYAVQTGAALLLYGHTHHPESRYLPESGLYIGNPGSIGHPEDGCPVYGLLDVRPEGMVFSHGRLPR